jgi:hypothetical protein
MNASKLFLFNISNASSDFLDCKKYFLHKFNVNYKLISYYNLIHNRQNPIS